MLNTTPKPGDIVRCKKVLFKGMLKDSDFEFNKVDAKYRKVGYKAKVLGVHTYADQDWYMLEEPNNDENGVIFHLSELEIVHTAEEVQRLEQEKHWKPLENWLTA